VGAADLARCMPFQREPCILRVHAVPVVFDAHALLSAELGFNRDAAGAGGQRVLAQFLGDGSRALDDLPRSDPTAEPRGKTLDRPHRPPLLPPPVARGRMVLMNAPPTPTR